MRAQTYTQSFLFTSFLNLKIQNCSCLGGFKIYFQKMPKALFLISIDKKETTKYFYI